jgi:hypothetical protein
MGANMTKKNESIMFKIAQKILKHEDKFLATEKKIKEVTKAAKDEAIKLKEATHDAHLSDKMKKGIKLANDHRRTFLTEKKKPKRKRKKAKEIKS